MTPDELFADVVSYAERPAHRTGTEDDAWTIDWFAGRARADGATVAVEQWELPQWRADWSAELDGQPVPSLPLWYGCVGSYGPSAVTVVATPHEDGFLTVPNRDVDPSPPTRDRATVMVPGRLAGREREVRATVTGARIEVGRSANVLATYGCGLPDAEVLVATPLSGWFSCAAERGSGISVALAVARELAGAGRRVALLGTSGHELMNLGLERWLSRRGPEDLPPLVVHLGANVAARAAGLGPARLSQPRGARSNVADAAPRLVAAGFTASVVGRDPSEWLGEAVHWCTVSRTLLSLVGGSRWFHAPEDLPSTATDPRLLAEVGTALLGDVAALLERTG